MYKIGDRIKHIRNHAIETPTDLIDTGTVTYGPVKVEGVEHYRVKWDSLGDSITNEIPTPLLSSTKHSYKLI